MLLVSALFFTFYDSEIAFFLEQIVRVTKNVFRSQRQKADTSHAQGSHVFSKIFNSSDTQTRHV